MGRSKQVFKRTSNTARVAAIIAYVGLGSSQLVLVPPLGDPLGMVEEQLMSATSPFFDQNHDIQTMHCVDIRQNNQKVGLVFDLGGPTRIRDMKMVRSNGLDLY